MLMNVTRYPRNQHQDQPLRVFGLFSRRDGGIDSVDIQERVQGRQQVLRRIPSGFLSLASLYVTVNLTGEY